MNPLQWPLACFAARIWGRLVAGLEALQPLGLLAARLYVADVFWKSGLTKLRDWDTTGQPARRPRAVGAGPLVARSLDRQTI